MDNQLLQTLQEIGLRRKEAEAYLTLLRIGNNPASTIAKKSGQNRSTCYSSLEKLMQKGFVQQIIIGKINYFSAVEPKCVLDQLKARRYHLEEKIDHLNTILPRFENLKDPMQNKSKVFFYEGKAGIQNVLEDTLTSKEPIRAYASFEELISLFPEYLPQYYRKRKQKKLFVRALYPRSIGSQKHQEQDFQEMRETRLLPPELNFPLDILVYDHKLAISSLKEKFAIVIENQEIANAQKKLFDVIWTSLDTGKAVRQFPEISWDSISPS